MLAEVEGDEDHEPAAAETGDDDDHHHEPEPVSPPFGFRVWFSYVCSSDLGLGANGETRILDADCAGVAVDG